MSNSANVTLRQVPNGVDRPLTYEELDKNFQELINVIDEVNNAQLEDKLDKTDIVQISGQSITKVMSQKAVTDAMAGIVAGQTHWGAITGNIENQTDLQNALGAKVDKVQTKEIVTANKTLTAADSGKLLIINSDGITITMPANSEFNVDVAKMDENFITIVQCAGDDKFREDTATILVTRDVSITNSGVEGKEWLAIGAYEV